ncbi:MAG: chromate transporter [Chthoniobacterales bacterium]|nr:chromate transporter [Chthoniobacterales bacterium]
MSKIVELINVFALLSLLAVGGGTAVLPEMEHVTVERCHWVSDTQFAEIYSLGQLAPGPNMTCVSLIGYEVSGVAGLLAVLVAFFFPASLLCYFASKLWDSAEGSPWRDAVQRGMAPVVIGFMLAGCYTLGKTASYNPAKDWDVNLFTLGIGAAVAVILNVTKINPALTILAGGAAGLFLLG